MKKVYFKFFLLAALSVATTSCRDDGITPPRYSSSVKLSVDYTSCTEVWMKIGFTDASLPRGFRLLRDGQMILSGTLTSDTLVIDTGVVAGRTYTYLARRVSNSSVNTDSSAPLQARTLDSTSHAIQWFVDTLGTQGVIWDCWAFSRDSAIAVGEIHTPQTDRFDSTNHWIDHYNVAQWDGLKWNLKRVYYTDASGTGLIQSIHGIYAIGNSFWLSGGSIFLWDGSSSQAQLQFSRLSLPSQNATVEKLWGSSNSRVYGVGNAGTIVSYNGNTWQQMASETGVDLQDIYGLDANHIWATGTMAEGSRSVILSYDGSQWNLIYDSDNVPWTERFSYTSVWTDYGNILYLASGGLPRRLRFSTNVFTTMSTGQTYASTQIRGIKENDIFIVGYGSEIVHYNGSGWYLYTSIVPSDRVDVTWRRIRDTKDFILVGGDHYFGYNSAPLVMRGYR